MLNRLLFLELFALLLVKRASSGSPSPRTTPRWRVADMAARAALRLVAVAGVLPLNHLRNAIEFFVLVRLGVEHDREGRRPCACA